MDGRHVWCAAKVRVPSSPSLRHSLFAKVPHARVECRGLSSSRPGCGGDGVLMPMGCQFSPLTAFEPRDQRRSGAWGCVGRGWMM